MRSSTLREIFYSGIYIIGTFFIDEKIVWAVRGVNIYNSMHESVFEKENTVVADNNNNKVVIIMNFCCCCEYEMHEI
jgi:hypothetical protein